MTHWNGNRMEKMPAEIRKMCERARATGKPEPILLFFHDPEGRLVKTVSPVVHELIEQRRPLDTMYEKLLGELKSIAKETKASESASLKAALHLPDVADGVRIYLKVKAGNRRPGNYLVPAVEAVAANSNEKGALAWPSRSTQVDAARLSRWLEQVYPPAIMERTGKVTAVSGSLTLSPVASDRTAILKGEAELTLDDGRDSRYRVAVEAVLTYGTDGDTYRSLRGVCRGTYSRREGGGTVSMEMTVAIESRPE